MKNKKTITIVSNKITRGDGQGRVNYEIAKAALSNGYAVNLVTTEADQALTKLGANFVKIKKLRLPDLLSLPYFVLKANQIIKRLEPKGIIIANGFSITTQHDLNIAHFVHFGWLNSGYYQPKLRISKAKSWYYNLYTRLNCYFEKISFSKATKIVAVSKMIADDLVAIGVDRKKISTINNGVDCKEFCPATHKETHQTKKIVFMGDIKSTRKNLESVLEAIKYVKNIRLSVFGSISGSIYPELAKRYNITKKVDFLGYQTDAALKLREADIFIFPSRYDPCPLVIMEAMASGLAIVTSRKVGNWPIVSMTGSEIIENPEDVESIKNILLRITRNDKQLDRLKKTSRKIAIQYDWQIVMKKYFDLIKNYE